LAENLRPCLYQHDLRDSTPSWEHIRETGSCGSRLPPRAKCQDMHRLGRGHLPHVLPWQIDRTRSAHSLLTKYPPGEERPDQALGKVGFCGAGQPRHFPASNVTCWSKHVVAQNIVPTYAATLELFQPHSGKAGKQWLLRHGWILPVWSICCMRGYNDLSRPTFRTHLTLPVPPLEYMHVLLKRAVRLPLNITPALPRLMVLQMRNASIHLAPCDSSFYNASPRRSLPLLSDKLR
jgi:hypothetical protein